MKLALAFLSVFFWATTSFAQSPVYDNLDINRVSARINSNGSHFWDQQGASKYEVPKGSFTNSLFCFGLWFGGLDTNQELHLAGARYNNGGLDFFPGPVSDTIYYTSAYDSLWNKVWKISRTEIEYHKTHYWVAGYTPPDAILNWPGNGNTAMGQSLLLAPFYDMNNDQAYDPLMGDYPLIRGDQAVFFIMNDARSQHMETHGKKVGLEIHGMAYAYNCPADSALVYSTFLHYDIYNRSTNTYHDTYIGAFVDTDLGDAWDDYVGCDVERGSFICYNGDNIDGSGQAGTYGAFPPAISTTVLAGPFLNPDNLDNPKLDNLGNPLCDLSINGYSFGDGILDNERYGLSSFFYTTNCASGPTCDPDTAPEFYNLLQGKWRDGVHLKYGGNGHPNSGSSLDDCNFMFPDLTDFCNWGTNGIQPAGFTTGAGGTGPSWTEANAGNPPNDRRGTISMGPFTFLPGDRQEMDLAFVWARQYTDSLALAAVTLLKSRIDQLWSYFHSDSIPCGGSFSGINSIQNAPQSLVVYPNPATTLLNIKYDNHLGHAEYQVFNVLGELVGQGKLLSKELNQISINNITPGLYFLVVHDGNKVNTNRFIRK